MFNEVGHKDASEILKTASINWSGTYPSRDPTTGEDLRVTLERTRVETAKVLESQLGGCRLRSCAEAHGYDLEPNPVKLEQHY